MVPGKSSSSSRSAASAFPLGLILLTLLASGGILATIACYLATANILADPVRIHVAGIAAASREQQNEKIRFLAEDANNNVRPAVHLQETSYWWLEHVWINRIIVQMSPADLAGVASLSVTIGGREPLEWTGDELRAWPRDVNQTELKNIVISLPVQIPTQKSALPWVKLTTVNWPGDANYFRNVAQYSLVPILLVGLVSFWCGKMRTPAGREFCRQILSGEWRVTSAKKIENSCQNQEASESFPNSPLATRHSPLIDWGGLLFLSAMLTLLEVRDPYYFTQCDTLSECFPMILVGCHSYWTGEFPDYNPYVFLGIPLASLGMYALTYPPLLLSYAIARHVLNNEYATIEVFAVLHLIAGFLATRLLGRKLGMSPLPANLVGLSVVLSGSSLIMGRSWFNFIPLVVWTPLVFLGLLKLRDGRVSWKWVLGMGLALGMPIHVGFTQVALYIVGFFLLAVICLALSGSLPMPRLVPVGAALLVAAAVAVPLVYQQMRIAQEVNRQQVHGVGIACGLAACLLPYPLVETQTGALWGNVNIHLMGHFYFFGGVLALLFFFHIAGLFCLRPRALFFMTTLSLCLVLWFTALDVRGNRSAGTVPTVWTILPYAAPLLALGHVVGSLVYRPGRREWPGQLWSICALAALWLALGSVLGLWDLGSNLPVVGFINRHALRMMPFFVFFASLVGGLTLERLLQHFQVRPRGQAIIATAALALLALHVWQCRTAFHVDGYRPYPPIPAEFAREFWRTDHQVTGRVTWWGPHSLNEAFGRMLPQNVPGVYGLPSMEGTNPLLESKKFINRPGIRTFQTPLAGMRAYGVRWHLIQLPEQRTPIGTNLTVSWQTEVLDKHDKLWNAQALVSPPFRRIEPPREGVVLYELPGADPLAFAVDAPAEEPQPGKEEVTPRPALPIEFHGGGVDVDITNLPSDQWVTVNFLRYPGSDLHAYVDGEEVVCKADYWERIVVRLPKEGRTLSIRYSPPWATGCLLALLPALLAGILVWRLGKK